MSLKKAYLYLVSIISLIIIVVASIMLINMALKTWVFTKADTNFYMHECFPGKPVENTAEAECTAEEKAAQEKINADNRAAQKQRDAAQSVSMLLVAVPVWFFHWRMARKEA